MNLSGREKATIFLSILGSDSAGRVLRYLPEELADVIATSVTHLPTPTPEALGNVLSEFRSYLAIGPARPVQAIDAKTVAEIHEFPLQSKTPETPLEILNAASSKKLAYLFSFERPLLIAFILARLAESKREDVLGSLGQQKQAVSDLLAQIKSNLFTAKLEEKLLKFFSDKV